MLAASAAQGSRRWALGAPVGGKVFYLIEYKEKFAFKKTGWDALWFRVGGMNIATLDVFGMCR